MLEGLGKKLRSGLTLSAVSGLVFGAVGFVVTVVSGVARGVTLSLEDLLLIPGWIAVGGFLIGALYSAAIAVGAKDGTLGRAKSTLLGFLTGPGLAAALFLGEGIPFDGRFLRASLVLGGVAAGLGYMLGGLTQRGEEAESGTSDEAPVILSSPNPPGQQNVDARERVHTR